MYNNISFLQMFFYAFGLSEAFIFLTSTKGADGVLVGQFFAVRGTDWAGFVSVFKIFAIFVETKRTRL